jgi:hypothetical protein
MTIVEKISWRGWPAVVNGVFPVKYTNRDCALGVESSQAAAEKEPAPTG